ncbi:MAG: GAF domain-containing protein [Anaerolineae bacterium]
MNRDLTTSQGSMLPSPPADQSMLAVHLRLSRVHTLDEQLQALMEIIIESLGAERATLFLHDAQAGELYARIAVGEARREIRLLTAEGVAGHVFTTAQSMLAPDAYESPFFNPRIDELTGFRTRSVACVPMRAVDGTIIGVAQALNKQEGVFADEDLSLLETITAQAALVLRSTLLVQEVERTSRQQSSFMHLVSELSAEIQLGPLLQKIMEAVTRMLDADRATLFLNDEKTGELFSEIGQGLGAQKIRFPNDRGIAGAVFTTGKSINIPHAYADLRFNPSLDRQTGYFTRSILSVPVINKAGKVIGVTQVLNKRGGAFADDDEARLRAFTAQIAIGLENAKLFDDVQAMKQYNDSVLASMTNGVLTLDPEGKVVTCNAAGRRILQMRLEDLLGQDAATYFAGPNAWVMEKLERALASGTAETALDAALQVGDETAWINLTALPLTGARREVLGSMLLLDDISRERRIKSTMSRYVDASVTDRLLESEAEVLGGHSSVVTVLFSDVRGFTPLAEQLGPQATVALLNDYFTRMVFCVEGEGGMLDKFIGDAMMAVFGVPFPHDDDPDRAVRAAIAMMRALRLFNRERAVLGQAQLRIGIGLNTGDAFTGSVGSPRRMDFTVMGDGVNLASRLEGAGKFYGTPVLLSDFTLKALRGTYRTREIDRVIVRGKTEPVAIHELLEYHDEESFPHLIDVLPGFRDGLALYRSQRWADAVKRFEHCLTLNPKDEAALRMIQRCGELAQDPPGEDWDGVWTLKDK